VAGGYASRAALASLLQSNRRMTAILRALMCDYPSNLNARQIMLLGQLCVELAGQASAIAEIEKITRCEKRPQTF